MARFSNCEVAGAVAEAALHDLRVNLFAFSGFPQILVDHPVNDMFKISLIWSEGGVSTVSIELTKAEAKASVKMFRDKQGYNKVIFDRIQEAIANLEYKSRNNK